MVILSLNSVKKKEIDNVIQQSLSPTIIGIARKNSFGARWIGRVLSDIELEYKNQISIYIYYYDSTNKIMSMLGEKQSLVLYFVKNKELKSCIGGSIPKPFLKKEMEKILF